MPRTRWIIAGVLFVTLVTALVKPMRGPATSPPIVPAQTNFSALIARLLDGDADARRVAQEAGVRLDAPAFPDRLSRLCADASADFGLRVCAARLLVRAYGLAGYGLRVDSTASAPFWERRETLGLIPKAPAPSGAVPRSAVGPLLVATLEETPFWPAADGADRISRRLAATRDTALTSYLLGQVRAPGRRQAALGVTLARMGHPEGRAWLLSAVRGQRFRGGALVAEALKEMRDAQALQALKEGLRDGPPWARLRSAELLARLGDPSGVDALRSLVSNATPDAPTLALNAADVIADLGLTSVIPALRASASRQGGYGLSVIASALSRLGDEAGVRTLIDTALARPESRAAGVYMAGRWGRIDLRPFLADPDTVVRFYATEAMKEQGLGVRGQGAGKAKAGVRYQVSGVRDSSLPDTRHPTPDTAFHKGVSLDGWRVQRVTPETLAELKGLGVNAVSYLPFVYQDEDDGPALREGEFEQYGAVLSACAEAHRAGMGIAIKPHVWVRERETWHGRIAMKTEEDWKAWFQGYGGVLLKFAAVAEAGGADLFCVGTELSGTTEREADWRALIREVRSVYRGRLAYAANWDREPERVAFWDALDFIGIDAYYPLSTKASPSVDDLVAGWGPILGRIEALHRRFDRPVLFMEVGYPATEGAAQTPYREERGRPLDLVGQATCYEALFRACLGRPWMAGMYLWRWNDPDWRSGPWDPSYNPKDKPAVAVIRKWYGGN